MKIGEQTILIPRDDKIGYDLDWRSRIADAVIATGKPLPKAVCDDYAVKALLACIKGEAKPDIAYMNAMSVKASPMMSRVVEAFLLTRASNTQISDETGIPDGVIGTFELLYYNVRNRWGDPIQSQVLRIALDLEAGIEPATPAERIDRVMKKAAIDGDIHLLRSYLPQRRTGLSQGSFAGTLVQRELNRRLLRGELSTGSLIKLRGLEIAEDRMTLSLNKTGGQTLHGDGDFYVGDMNALRCRM